MYAKAMWEVVDSSGKRQGNPVGRRESASAQLRRFKSQGQNVQGWYVRPYQFHEDAIHGPAMPAPFPIQDNGVHWYFEDAEILVLNNRGSVLWTGMAKRGGGYAVVASGECPATVLATTRQRRLEMEKAK